MDGARLERAVRQADLRVLLMVLFHLTGDRSWLEIRPRRDVRLIADESAGLSEQEQERIRHAAIDLLSGDEPVPVIHDPGDELMVEMMSVCLGENVPPEYALMMREELGLCSRDIEMPAALQDKTEEHSVLIAGAGVSGLALGSKLKKLGVPYTIIEKNGDVGGTWYENRYPGCGVDTPNHAYSFSYGRHYPWARYFSDRDQIQNYLELCADDFGVRPNIRFRTKVVGATWDEERKRWSVDVEGPEGRETLTATVFVSAIGQFSTPAMPNIKGIDEFGGETIHSARWPDDVDLKGKRVAIVGTGASSMQMVPTIVDDVAALTVFQRTAQWARPIPRYHDLISEEGQWLLEKVPYYAQWFRFTMLWRYGDGLLQFLKKDPNWRHPERSLNRVNDRHRQEMTDHIHAQLADRPDLIEKCLPAYPPYGKRILLDNGWYRAISKPNCELVSENIERVTENGVVTADGIERGFDAIVYATGFQMSQMAAKLNVRGTGGVPLADVWAGDNPTAHLGITVPSFPNFFCMLGPNTGLGHGGSAVFLSECQSRYIVSALISLMGRNSSVLDVKKSVHDEYVARVDDEHAQLIWTHPGMSTYYRNSHGRVFSVMPWRLVDYWQMTHDLNEDDFVFEGAA